MRFDRKAPGDQRSHGCGPGLLEKLQITDRRFEGCAPSIDGPEYHLVFEHEVAHHQIGIDFYGALATGHASKDEDAVHAEMLNHVEGELRSARGFIDQIDVADFRSELFEG